MRTVGDRPGATPTMTNSIFLFCVSRGRLLCVAYPTQQPTAARAQHACHLCSVSGCRPPRIQGGVGEPPGLEPPRRLRVAAHRLAHSAVRVAEACRGGEHATRVEEAGGVGLERLWPVDDPLAEEVGQVAWWAQVSCGEPRYADRLAAGCGGETYVLGVEVRPTYTRPTLRRSGVSSVSTV